MEGRLALRTEERDHLTELVAKMESAADQDEVNRAQVADLKGEIAKNEGEIFSRKFLEGEGLTSFQIQKKNGF